MNLGVRAGRCAARSRDPGAARRCLPADLVYLLFARLGLDEAGVARMTKDEVVARLRRYWTEGA